MTLKDNGYPDRFIASNMRLRPKSPTFQLAKKKEIFLSLPYKGERITDSMNRRLQCTLERTYPAATLKSWSKTQTLLDLNVKDKLPKYSQSMIVYSFSCSCAAEYVGRTTRQLQIRIKEHNPAWLWKGQTKTTRSSIVAHLVDTQHVIDVNNSFRVIYRADPRLSKAIQAKHIATAEAIAIKNRKPSLCQQKILVQALKLAWPESRETNRFREFSQNYRMT